MIVFWTILVIALIVMEASTAQLVCIWFAGGAFVSLITAIITEDLLIQFTVFVVVSAVLLFSTRNLVKKLKNPKDEKTNIDALIGKSAVVTERISNAESAGTAKLEGKLWTARSFDGNDIEAGTTVTVEQIDGVKLIVK